MTSLAPKTDGANSHFVELAPGRLFPKIIDSLRFVWTFCTSSRPTREPGDALRRCMFAKIPLAIPTRESNPNGLINCSIKRLFQTVGAVSNTFPTNCESVRLFVTGGADWYPSATNCSIGISGPGSVDWTDVWISIFLFMFIESSPNFLLFPNTLGLHSSRTEGFSVSGLHINSRLGNVKQR